MQVKLVSITKPVVDGITTAEELLVYIARVSNPGNQLNTGTADRLIKYLIDHKHWSPFDMVNMEVEVVTSRAIAQQILRHWSIKPQEFSQRYAQAVSFEPVELRRQAGSNRQSSDEVFNPKINVDCGNDIVPWGFASDAIDDHIQYCENLYKALLEAGVAKECARFVLPLCTSTTLYLNGSVRSWIHYMEQRCDAHAQKEHQEVAGEIRKIFIEQFPYTAQALQLIER